MRVLMISLDKGLLNVNPMGDVIERHRSYGEQVERLDIIVFANHKYQKYQISSRVTAYPTGSRSRVQYVRDAIRLGKKLLQNNQYDLIVCQDPFATGLAGVELKKACSAKLLVGFHGDFFDQYYWQGSFLKQLIQRFSLKRVLQSVDHVRVVSEGIKESLMYKSKLSDNQITVVPTPVNIDGFHEDTEYQLKIQRQFNDKHIVLFVGRLVSVKDVPMLMRSFERIVQKVDNCVLVVIGSGPLESDIKELAQKSSAEIVMLSQLPHEEIIQYCFAADVLVLPSRSESFGKVLVEANACGTPVVATATTGAQSIVRDGYNGFLTPLGDEAMFTDRIVEVLSDTELQTTMGEQGRVLMRERFANNSERIIELWKKVCGC